MHMPDPKSVLEQLVSMTTQRQEVAEHRDQLLNALQHVFVEPAFKRLTAATQALVTQAIAGITTDTEKDAPTVPTPDEQLLETLALIQQLTGQRASVSLSLYVTDFGYLPEPQIRWTLFVTTTDKRPILQLSEQPSLDAVMDKVHRWLRGEPCDNVWVEKVPTVEVEQEIPTYVD